MVAGLVVAQDAFLAAVDALDDGEWADRRPMHYGRSATVRDIVGKIAIEHVHHGAEIALLRDLHRGHARIQPPPIPYDDPS